MPNLAVGINGRIASVREALEKIKAQGAVGTVDIERCITYLKEAEGMIYARQCAIDHFRTDVLGMED